MKICICTVIKNEHQYLDEWIQYHINLGIDHIFIFEDYDSDSHKEITDKYENVSLIPIFSILSETTKKYIPELKISRKISPQEIYFKRALLYIKNNYPEYQWGFVIDIDEFITLEDNSKTLEDIIQLYQDYDAFILQWKCYGANEIIQKPDYKEKGVIDTYTSEISGYIPTATPKSYTKTCYNLHNYKQLYFGYSHQPSDFCNFCRTDFSKDRITPIYDNIYIRHYITKSWEEYVNKVNIRGFLYGKIRTYDFFFEVNSDMLYLKDKLISELNNKTLVVLPYKQSGSQGNEIRLALNAWKKFCQFNYHFIVIGKFSDQLKNEFPWVEFIYSEPIQRRNNQYNQHLDVQHCTEVIMEKYNKSYTGFIWMVDDNYAIKPFNLSDIKTIHYHSSSFIGNEHQPASYWAHDKWKTRQLLDRESLPHINYTTHYPCYFEFKKLKEIWDKFNMRNESYVLEDIYFNYYEHEYPLLDSTIRLGIWSYEIYKNEFQKAVNNPNIKFICNSIEGWSKDLENDLEKIISSKQKKYNVLITGSRGFIGSSLVEYLKLDKENYNIYECDRKINKSCLDIDNQFIKDNNINCIVHLAASTSVWNDNLYQIAEDNIKSFIHIFSLAKNNNIKFIYASSSCSINITSMYGLSKNFNDEFIKLYNYGKCVCLRLHNVYGENSRQDTLCGRCLKENEITLYNSGNNTRHFTYIDDVCKGIKCAIEDIEKGNFNVLNETENSTLEFCNEIAKYKNLNIKLTPNIREYDKENQIVDTSYTNLIANNYISIQEGIQKIFENKKENH